MSEDSHVRGTQMESGPYPSLVGRLADLSARGFQQFIAHLLRSIGRYSDVEQDVRVGQFQVDIAARVRSTTGEWERVVFEVKKVTIVGSDLLRSERRRMELLRKSDARGRFVLVVSGHLTERARELSRGLDVAVWDVAVLAGLMAQYNVPLDMPFDSEDVPSPQATSKAEALASALRAIGCGPDEATTYQKWVADAVEYLFVPPLGPTHYEDSDSERRNRRDVILENWSPSGFWAQVRERYAAEQIVVDAKNYCTPLKKRPIIELSHYLKPYGTGMFGIIWCRLGLAPAGRHAIREEWIGGSKMIVVVDDDSAFEMLELRGKGLPPEETLRRAIADFRKSL